MLIMFVLYSASNAFQWTQLVIITSILEKYYNISTLAVYWTSMIYMVLYIPLIFPASWLLDKKVKSSLLFYFNCHFSRKQKKKYIFIGTEWGFHRKSNQIKICDISLEVTFFSSSLQWLKRWTEFEWI